MYFRAGSITFVSDLPVVMRLYAIINYCVYNKIRHE